MKSSGSRHCINQVCNGPSLFSSASAQCEVAKSGDAVLYCDHEMPITSFPSSKAPKVICPVGSRRFSLVKSFNSLLFFTPRRLCCVIGLASSGGDQLNFIYIDRVKLNNISMWPQLRCEKGRRESRATCAAVCGRFVVYFMLNKHVFLFFPYTGTRSSSIVYGGKMDFFSLLPSSSFSGVTKPGHPGTPERVKRVLEDRGPAIFTTTTTCVCRARAQSRSPVQPVTHNL